MKTVLFTGSGGFTGRYMRNALEAAGYRVIGLDAVPSDSGEGIVCDLTDPAAMRAAVAGIRPDAVLHLAAISHVGHTNILDFYRVNVLGTLNLLEALAQLDSPPKKIVIASSANVYGTPPLEVLDENVCPSPVNHYANSKLAMEHMVRTWFERLPILMTRPFNYTGPGQSEAFLIPKIVGHFRRREKSIELGNLDVSRDFSDVEDVVGAYVALLQSDAHSESVNICSGRAIALRDVLKDMAEIAGYKIDVRVNQEFVRENEIRRLTGSNEKLRRLTGFTPSVPFRETLEKMYRAG